MRPCSGRRESPRGRVATTPCVPHRRRSCRDARAGFRALRLVPRRPGRRGARFGRVVGGRGDRQLLADRIDPETLLVSVNVSDHFLVRRSSSAPKKAAALFRIPFARRSSRFSRPLTHFPWVTLLFVHDPILSNDGVSSKPGAIHRPSCSGKSARTANPAQTTAFFGVKRRFRRGAVDAGFPLQYSDFPHRRALSSAG